MSRSAPAALGCFTAVHVVLTLVGVLVVPMEAFWDLDLYRWWAWTVLAAGQDRPLLDEPWVYPAGALVPVLLPGLVAAETTGYAVAWCAMVTALDVVAALALVRAGGTRAVWWWAAFLAALGPVAIGRLDAVVVPLMVVALLVAVRRPRVAAALLTAGAWVKVAPGALLLAVAAATPRLAQVVATAAGVSAAVVVGAVATSAATGGDPPHLLSFLTTQRGRGLQTEAVAATPWVLASLRREDVAIVLDEELITYEVRGPGTAAVAGALDVVLVLAVLGVGVLLWWSRRRGTGAAALLPAALVLVLLLLCANKVGSPQLMAWIAAPVAALLAHDARPGAPGRVPVVAAGWLRAVTGLALLTAGLTQVLFPWGYEAFLAGDVTVTVVLALRNALLVTLLVIASACLVRAARGRSAAQRTGRRRLRDHADPLR